MRRHILLKDAICLEREGKKKKKTPFVFGEGADSVRSS